MIKFGTDGWRAVLDEEFNDDNVKTATLAVGKYIYDTFGLDKQIIIRLIFMQKCVRKFFVKRDLQ